MEPGVEVPRPRKPAEVKRAASESSPLLRVENVRSALAAPGPLPKVAWVSTEVIAEVVVAADTVVDESVVKIICAAVPVALPKLATMREVEVAPLTVKEVV